MNITERYEYFLIAETNDVLIFRLLWPRSNMKLNHIIRKPLLNHRHEWRYVYRRWKELFYLLSAPELRGAIQWYLDKCFIHIGKRLSKSGGNVNHNLFAPLTHLRYQERMRVYGSATNKKNAETMLFIQPPTAI